MSEIETSFIIDNIQNSRLIITRGSDKSFTLRLRDKHSGDPIDLTPFTNIEVVLKNADRSELILLKEVLVATKAYGIKNDITVTAITAGIAGNDIELEFDGIDTIDDVVSAWNTANPSNQAEYTGLDIVVPSEGTLRLQYGYASYSPIAVSGNVLLGKLLIKMLEKDTLLLKTGQNQSIKIILDEGQNTGGNRSVIMIESCLDVLADL